MNRTLIVFAVCVIVQAAKKPDVVITLDPPAVVAREMTVTQKQIPTLNVKVWNETWLIFPEDESVVSFAAGDIVSGDSTGVQRGNFTIELDKKFHRILAVKPALENRSTNLHVLTSRGNTYSFLLHEVSGCKTCRADLKVFVARDGAQDEAVKEQEILKAGYKKRIESLSATVQLTKLQMAEAEASATQAKRESTVKATREISAFKQHYPETMHLGYSFRQFKKPFEVEGIWNDGVFTWIKVRAQVVQTIYAEKPDGISLVQFEYKRLANGIGAYVINGIITAGYLQTGKKRLHFRVVSPTTGE